MDETHLLVKKEHVDDINILLQDEVGFFFPLSAITHALKCNSSRRIPTCRIPACSSAQTVT